MFVTNIDVIIYHFTLLGQNAVQQYVYSGDCIDTSVQNIIFCFVKIGRDGNIMYIYYIVGLYVSKAVGRINPDSYRFAEVLLENPHTDRHFTVRRSNNNNNNSNNNLLSSTRAQTRLQRYGYIFHKMI